MVPTAGLEVLGDVAAGELTEPGAAARTVELQLLTLEVGVADAQKEILLDAHEGRNADGSALGILLGELVEIDQRLVSDGRKPVENHAAGRILVERGELDPIVGELRGDGDGRRTLDDVISDIRTTQHGHGRTGDTHGQEVGLVDGQGTLLLLALAHEVVEPQRDDVGNGLAGGNDDPVGRKLVELAVEHGPIGPEPRVVSSDERRVDSEGHLGIGRDGKRQISLQRTLQNGRHVVERSGLHLRSLGDIEEDDVVELRGALVEVVARDESDGGNERKESEQRFHKMCYLAGFNVWIARRIMRKFMSEL